MSRQERKAPEQEDQADDDDDAPCVFILFHERFYSQAAQESYECKARGPKKRTRRMCVLHMSARLANLYI